jgi:hypothetical protein
VPPRAQRRRDVVAAFRPPLLERNCVMNRLVGPLLVGLGVFLLALAVLLPTVVVPRSEQAPLDAYVVSTATGSGSYLDPTTREFVDDDEITVTRVVRGDVEASSDDVAMYDVTQTVESAQVDEPLNVVAERVRFDRSTGEGVGGTGDRPRHDGAYVVKLPFNTERRDYDFWDATAAAAFPVSFQRETEVNGLDVYEFAGSVPELRRAQISVPGELVDAPDAASVFVEEYYTNDRTILVEPRTGSIVSTTSTPRRVWRPATLGDQAGEETVIFEADVAATEETVERLVSDAEDAKGSLNLYGRTLPLILGLLGLALILGGIVLVGRETRRPAHGYRDDTYDDGTVRDDRYDDGTVRDDRYDDGTVRDDGVDVVDPATDTTASRRVDGT